MVLPTPLTIHSPPTSTGQPHIDDPSQKPEALLSSHRNHRSLWLLSSDLGVSWGKPLQAHVWVVHNRLWHVSLVTTGWLANREQMHIAIATTWRSQDTTQSRHTSAKMRFPEPGNWAQSPSSGTAVPCRCLPSAVLWKLRISVAKGHT